MAATKAISSFQNNTNLENPPQQQSRTLANIQQMLESFLQQADALANNPNVTTDLLGKLEQINLPALNQESQGSYPENQLLLLQSTTRIFALIHSVLTNQNFKNLKGSVSDPSYKAVKSSLKNILSGLLQNSEKPQSAQRVERFPLTLENAERCMRDKEATYEIVKISHVLTTDQGLKLCDIPSDAFRVIVSCLTTEELLSLGRLFKCKAYAHLIPVIREIYYKKNPPKIFPCNYGTFIASGAPTMRLFFTGQDPSGQMSSTGKPCSVFLRELERLRHQSIVSVGDTTDVEEVFPQDRVSGLLLTLCDNGKVYYNGKAYSSNFQRDYCGLTPVDISDPVIEISSNQSLGHFLRTKKAIYNFDERGLDPIDSIPKPENIVEMTAESHLLAFMYNDGTVKVFDHLYYRELPVFLELEQVTLQSVEKIFRARGCIFLSMNSRFYKIVQVGEKAQLTEFISIAGKKVIKIARNGSFVFTEKDGVWARGVNSGGCLGIGNNNGQADYVQVRTLDNISEVFDISHKLDYATLFLAGGKLYFAGEGSWRYLVGQNPQEEYTIPTPISNTQHLTIKSAWSSGKNIWVSAETGVYQLSTVDKPLDGARRYDAPPILYFRDLESIPFNIAMLSAWTKIYAQQIFKSADWLSADDVIREAISSSSNLEELCAKIEKLRADMPTCTGLNQFFQYLKN